MKTKIVLLILAYFSIGIFVACDRNFNCEDTYYFNFGKLEIFADTTVIEQGKNLNFQVRPSKITYLAQQKTQSLFFSKAFALSCPDEGIGGLKIPITKIEIFSNNDFNTTHLKGALLNELFYVKYHPSHGYYTDAKIANLPFFDLYYLITLDSINEKTELFCKVKPTKSLKHIFTINLYQADGNLISISTREIEWK